jgi:hypothetical protein
MPPLRCRSAFMSLRVWCSGRLQQHRHPTNTWTGHGCGKLLQETSAGVFNFDVKDPPVSPLTGKPITTWYKPGQTWGSVFGGVAGAYEVLFTCLIPARQMVTHTVLGMPRRAGGHASEVSYEGLMFTGSTSNMCEVANSLPSRSSVSEMAQSTWMARRVMFSTHRTSAWRGQA